MAKPAAGQPITIKKYANRRLYNTATSSYVTLDDLCQMVKDGQDFAVFDAKTGEEITRSVLTQIIVEEEAKGTNLLPVSFLRQLIAFYGDSLQALVPKYLEHSMTNFAKNQEQIRDYLSNAFDGIFPFGSIEEMGKKNMAFVEQAMKMFAPFAEGDRPAPNGARKSNGAEEGKGGDSSEAVLNDLQKKIDALQEQLETLSKDKSARE
jgi:polyhydroxyalkanoate synthesis repressor PhaR